MTDIVERLRGWSGQGSPVSSTDIHTMTQKAAAEIERLEAQVEQLRAALDEIAANSLDAWAVKIAMAALEARREEIQRLNAHILLAEIERRRKFWDALGELADQITDKKI